MERNKVLERSKRAVNRLGASIALLAASGVQSAWAADTLTDAFRTLRAKPAMELHLLGSEVRMGMLHPIEVDAWSAFDYSVPTAKLKITSFYDGRFRYGWAADGVQLFHYDPDRNEYTSSIYGAFAGKQPDRMIDTLTQSVFALSKGAAIYPARFIRDIYAGDTAFYKSWMPDADPVEVNTKTEHTITYSRTTRQLVFTFDPDTGAFLSIDFSDQVWDAQQVVATKWRITFATQDAIPAAWDFSFTPPAGCRPVSIVHG